ncbi:hypothetical protein AOLI_G00246790 [Acnodon oligacanthus]
MCSSPDSFLKLHCIVCASSCFPARASTCPYAKVTKHLISLPKTVFASKSLCLFASKSPPFSQFCKQISFA